MKLKDNGITLIALVITIIILLILAGVTIGQLAGNGLFEKVQMAKERSDKSQEEENEILDEYINEIDKVTTVGTRNTKEDMYLTDEQVVGTWIDGNTIYRKVFNLSKSITSFGGVRYTREKYLDNISDVIDCGGYFILNNSKIKFGCSEINWNSIPSFHSYAAVEDNSLYIYILYNAENYNENTINGTVWVEYTKLTN